MTLNYKEITKISDIKKFVDYTHKTLKIDWHPDDGFMTIAEDDTSQYISYDLRRSLENRLEEIYKIKRAYTAVSLSPKTFFNSFSV